MGWLSTTLALAFLALAGFAIFKAFRVGDEFDPDNGFYDGN